MNIDGQNGSTGGYGTARDARNVGVGPRTGTSNTSGGTTTGATIVYSDGRGFGAAVATASGREGSSVPGVPVAGDLPASINVVVIGGAGRPTVIVVLLAGATDRAINCQAGNARTEVGSHGTDVTTAITS